MYRTEVGVLVEKLGYRGPRTVVALLDGDPYDSASAH